MAGHPYKSRPVADSHVWLTPPEILAPLGRFDLDPCAAPMPRPWPTADRHYGEAENGLSLPWFGRVWCNPPFGRHTETWLRRMHEHGNGIALTFARTETAMFQRYVWRSAYAVLFLAKRPHFYNAEGIRAKGNSGGPICLIAYGGNNADSLMECGLPGTVVSTQKYVEAA